MQVSLDLPCSSSGSTSISFKTVGYQGGLVPLWIKIDSNTGVLNITTPDIYVDTEFDFYIYSSMNISSNLIQIPKLIKLKVLNCNSQNCQKCKLKSNSAWAFCNSGYILYNITVFLVNLEVHPGWIWLLFGLSRYLELISS